MTRRMRTTERLSHLTEHGRHAASSANRDVDWSAPVRPPAWLPRQAYVTAISQFYYGELATIELCRRVLPALRHPAAERFVRTQIADEQRHAATYARYLRRIGGIGDIEEGVAMAYRGAHAWRGSHLGLIILSHVVLEGEGLGLQHLYGRWFPCPLFRQINRVIAGDEARHVAFGKIYLRAMLPALPLEERLEIFRWIRSLWFDCACALREHIPPTVLLLLGRTWIAERWRQQSRGLVDIGLVGEDEAAMFERS